MTSMLTGDRTALREAARLKANLLAEGIVPTPGFLEAYGPPFLSKRRAYGNPDDLSFIGRDVPQELYIDDVICAVNIRSTSSWRLDHADGEFFVRDDADSRRTPVTFPRHPWFYDQVTPGGVPVNSVVTLYGGASLGVFIYGNCALVDMGAACQYCSIEPNRSRETQFANVIGEAKLAEALTVALRDPECPISQVMLNGGNFPDPDRSFSHYVRMCEVAREVIDASGRDVDLHLIVYPPHDLSLFERLDGLGVGLAMNCEVWDPELFKRYCPGKTEVSGQDHIVRALRHAAQVLGEGTVYSIFVGGLEPVESLREGLHSMASSGVVPVVNVFHSDPDTPLADRPSPSADVIMAMGAALQECYESLDTVVPFYLGCGRNAIDTEAHWGLFA